MINIPHYVADSKIPGAGKGLFTSVPIKKGTEVVVHYDRPHIFCTEAKFQELCGKGDKRALEYGTRFYSDIFSYPVDYTNWEVADSQDFINHSDNPTLHRVQKISLATRDIEKDEELTLDYRFYLPDCDSEGQHRSFLTNGETNLPVYGYDNHTAGKLTIEKFMILMDLI